MDEPIRLFLDRVDASAKPGQRFNIYHLGRSALMMHYGFQLSTMDVDFVAMQNDSDLEKKATELFGKDTPLAQALGFYLDAVVRSCRPSPPASATAARKCQATGR